MTEAEKLTRIKAILGISDSNVDALLKEYLSIAETEILNWLFSNMTMPESATLPPKYEQVQVMAVVEAYSMRGAEGQTKHNELDVERDFKYPDLIEYIHAHVYPYAGIDGYTIDENA